MRSDLYPTGRKHCSRCGCWRLLYEFNPIEREGPHARLGAWCRTCQARYNEERRRARGARVRTETHCLNGHLRTPENTYYRPSDGRPRCRDCRRATERTPLARERQRIYRNAKRAEAGLATRQFKRKPPQDSNERVLLDAEPFADWLREHAPGSGEGRERWSLAHGVDESQVRRLQEREQARVHINTVDRVAGPQLLNELYPFEDRELVAA